ncbi:Gfo/Idh/MocA family protein [Rhizobium oryzicola]|uniref:Gfo/Idh/MocA family oxidoreductase n=1 Tax=Rhizobium oryzicola TaxID=1232668 RepID=A0ABT8SX57_9HYPH|nr:Gfo/Idh/MocA family oxidoreductase [Rhizobium oryzicola]MDO1583018.1 Gfo/Idh/MocA family oxidoreductase [Rhizobium oryzicola]
MTDRVRVAVVGAGIGKAHVKGYAHLPDAFDVVYVCDLNQARGEDAATLVPGAAAVTDIEVVLADPTIDIVDICLPPQLHVPMTLGALAAGKHVVCEKPFAGSLGDARRLLRAARESGRHVFPVFQYRYGTSYRALHELKQRGMLGRPYVLSMETHWQRGADYYAEPWRGTWKGELGGVLVSHACHLHNLATHLVGPITDVAAFMETRVNPIETEDCAAISMRSAEGALITSSVTLGSAGNLSRLRASFEHLTVTSSDEPYEVCSAPWIFRAADPARQAEVDAIVSSVDEVPPRFPGFFADVHRKLTGQPDMYLPTLEEAYHSVELITAFYASARARSIITLPLPANFDDRDFQHVLT